VRDSIETARRDLRELLALEERPIAVAVEHLVPPPVRGGLVVAFPVEIRLVLEPAGEEP
jgi:hypothetical protein